MVQWDYKFSVFMVWNDVSQENQEWILVCYYTPVVVYTTAVYF